MLLCKLNFGRPERRLYLSNESEKKTKILKMLPPNAIYKNDLRVYKNTEQLSSQIKGKVQRYGV